MHCNLVKLPAELLLVIVQKLRQDEDLRARASEEEEFGIDKDERVRIYHDVVNWSSTCSYFRNLLTPEIMKTVKLVNDEKSGSSLNTVATSQHNAHVKELHFLGSALGNIHVDKAVYLDTQGILPRGVEKLICELQRFPSLERLSLKFDYKFENPRVWMWSMDIFAVESSEQILEAEASVAWRALMARTYSALARNKTPHFKSLEIKHHVWSDVSTFSDAAFHSFLGQIEQFTLSSQGKYNLKGWRPSTPRQYPVVLRKINEYLLNHLANVTTLHIKDVEFYPFGLDGRIHTPLPLRTDQMPLLTNLHLDYTCASRELVNFLISHKDTMEQLTLCDCYALIGAGGNGLYWSQFFTSLFFACPAQLRRFDLVGDEMSLLRKQLEKEGDQEVSSRLREEPRRLCFLYADVEDQIILFYDSNRCSTAFKNGEDQSSWDRLMGLVEGNAKRAGKDENKGVDQSWIEQVTVEKGG